MKKSLLIIAITLVSAVSAFAFSGSAIGVNAFGNYTCNTKKVSYSLSGEGQFRDIIQVSYTNGTSTRESYDNRTVSGSFTAPGTSYISNIYMETVCQMGYVNGKYVYLGTGSITATW